MGAPPGTSGASLGNIQPQGQGYGVQQPPMIGGRPSVPRGSQTPSRTGASPTALSIGYSTANSRRTSTGTPQTGGGYLAPTAPGGGPAPGAGGNNPAMDQLLALIRQQRAQGSIEREDITNRGLSQGLGRSQGAEMSQQMGRETGAVQGVQRDWMAEQFNSARQEALEAQRAQLERERMAQQGDLSRQQMAFERESLAARMAAEREQSGLDRESRESVASMDGGGGGGGTSLSDITGRRPGYGGQPQSGFGGWSGQNVVGDVEAERIRQQNIALRNAF